MNTTNNILFITLGRIDSIKDSGIYNDLAEELGNKSNLTIICPLERRFKIKSRIIKERNITILQQWTPNIQKTNKIEKGIATLTIEFFLLYGYLKNLRRKSFDLLLISTPPIFLLNIVRFLKLRNHKIKIYLLLKDIFPQNALDLNLISKNSLFYKICKRVERKLYLESTKIGCMSRANLDYMNKINNVPLSKLEINPNCINPNKYLQNIKSNRSDALLRLVYGGNLGLPQDPALICNFISRIENLKNVKLTICGDGTEYMKIKDHIESENMKQTILLSTLPKKEYFELLKNSDIGLIFLNNAFTIPNYPSRILDYIFFDLNVIALTDPISDLHEILEKENIGHQYSEPNSQLDRAIEQIEKYKKNGLQKYNGSHVIRKYFEIENSVRLILSL
jgi:glycosyltransferase involved in cell wall biosynthesis